MSDGITYQNKDTISKVFAEKFGSKSLKVYGINIPRIVKILPTNLPVVEADEKRADNIYELEDGSIAIIDYESKYDIQNVSKYMSYIARVLAKFFEEGRTDIQIRLIVIYTADVVRDKSKETYKNLFGTLKMQSAYLSELDSEKIRKRLTDKVRAGKKLTDNELMEFIILPLTYRTKQKKQEVIRECIDLAKDVKDTEQSIFIIAGIVVFSDKVIDQDTASMARRWIDMTQVGRIYEKERVEYGAREAEMADARRLVDDVERMAHAYGVTVTDVCEKIGLSSIDYDRAKRILAERKELVEA